MLPISVIIPYTRQHEPLLARAVYSAFYAGANEVLAQEDVNIGVCGTRNLLAARCKNDWIVPLDADDELLPDSLRFMSEAWQEKSWVYGDYMIENELVPNARPQRIYNKAVCHATILFHKDDFNRVGGYDVDFNIGAEDHALCLALTRAGVTPIKINAPVYRKTMDETGRGAKCFNRRDMIRLLMREKFGISQL